jgi:hypothetical protein
MLWSHSWLVEIKETSESDFQIKIFRIVKENKNLWNFNWFKWNKHVVMKKNPLAILQVWSVTPDTENSADGTHTAGHLAQRKKLEAGGNENVAQLRGRTRSEAGVTRRNWWFLLFFFFFIILLFICAYKAWVISPDSFQKLERDTSLQTRSAHTVLDASWWNRSTAEAGESLKTRLPKPQRNSEHNPADGLQPGTVPWGQGNAASTLESYTQLNCHSGVTWSGCF